MSSGDSPVLFDTKPMPAAIQDALQLSPAAVVVGVVLWYGPEVVRKWLVAARDARDFRRGN